MEFGDRQGHGDARRRLRQVAVGIGRSEGALRWRLRGGYRRGVGRSEGAYDEGVGEIDDAEAAYRWLQQQFPGLPNFIWGFSFGSRVGLDLSIRLHEEVAGYLAVAWPTNFYSWPETGTWPARTAFLAGTEDEFVDFDKMGPAEAHEGRITILEGAGHFFPGQLDHVRSYTADNLNHWLHG